MRTVHIYSINNRKWYTHTMPADSPAPSKRGAYCATILSAPDNSSHQLIIMGGGSTGENYSDVDGATAQSSVWALNIPSMQWVELPKGAEAARSVDPGGRVSPSCAVIGKSYIMMSGGRKVAGVFERPNCDVGQNNIFLYNTNTGKWSEDFDPAQEYQLRDEVTKVIGGKYVFLPRSTILACRASNTNHSKNGGSTLKSPPGGGFSDPALAEILKFPLVTPNADGTTSPSSKDDNPTSEEPKKKSHTVAIAAGASVGGVGAIVIIIVIIWEVRRRKRARSPAHPPLQELASTSTGNGAAGIGAGGYNPYGNHELPNEPYGGWPKHDEGEHYKPQYYQDQQEQHQLRELPGNNGETQGARGELPGSQVEYQEMPGMGLEPVEAYGRERGQAMSMDVHQLQAQAPPPVPEKDTMSTITTTAR